jgi:hypothetical protein
MAKSAQTKTSACRFGTSQFARNLLDTLPVRKTSGLRKSKTVHRIARIAPDSDASNTSKKTGFNLQTIKNHRSGKATARFLGQTTSLVDAFASRRADNLAGSQLEKKWF